MGLETAIKNTIAGLDGHSKAIAVLGDNIANISSAGFKRSRTEFADLISDLGNSSPEIQKAGTGSSVAQIRQIHTDGIIEPTDRSLDAAIAGNGFFQVGSTDERYLTRAGNFTITADGLLVTQNGLNVLGVPAGGTDVAPIDMLNIDLTGQATSTISVAGNLSAASSTGETTDAPENFNELGQLSSFTNSVEVYDSLGFARTISLYYTKTDDNAWSVQAWADGGDVGGTEGVPTLLGDADLTFQSDGTLSEADAAAATLTATADWDGAAQANLSIDLSGLTQFASLSQISNVSKNGQKAGSNVRDYEIDTDGSIYALLDTGDRSLIATLQLANVASVDSLTRTGSGLYSQNDLTGDLTTGIAGSSGFGQIQGRSLERSNVDITNEFTDLIVYQSGYQANSQLLSAATELIRNTIGLIR